MTWIRIDDALPEHPKIIGLAAETKWVYVVGICYSSRFLTDGYVPSEVVNGSKKAAQGLVKAGLWTPDGQGYQVHDYLEYQQSRTEVEQRRKQRSEAGRKGAHIRWQQP